MPFVPKNLDDRTFEDLVREARRRIAAYVPEWQVDQRGRDAKAWTEFNPSDPGITLVDVFAFLTETTLFRLNRTPDERMYLEFLNLLGIAPRPALPSSLPLIFEMRQAGGSLEMLPHELRFSAPGEEEDIFFEPDREVSLIRANLGA